MAQRRSTRTRRTSQRLDDFDHDIPTPQRVRVTQDEPTVASSIRDTARNVPVGRNARTNVRFDIQYHQRRRVVTQTQSQSQSQSQTQTQTQPQSQAEIPHTEPEAMEREEVTNQPDAQDNTAESTHVENPYFVRGNWLKTRICYCDMFRSEDMECKECDLQGGNVRFCEDHALIDCAEPSCDYQIHKKCMLSLGCSMEEEWYCVKHQNINTQHIPYEELRDDFQKAIRLGCEFNPDNVESMRNSIEKAKQDLEQTYCLPVDTRNSILNTDPSVYPEILKMDEESKKQHAIQGRKFEMALLRVLVKTCACCQITIPVNDDKKIHKITEPLPMKHLVTKFKKSFLCRCIQVCKGEQYYYRKREKDVYSATHAGKKCDKDNPDLEEVELCYDCWNEIDFPREQTEEGDRTLMCVGRMFSRRNGFGKSIDPQYTGYTIFTQPDEDQLSKSQRLHVLLSTCTAVEEAAIRQIAPLQSLVALREGNLKTKGTTFLVWQDSKLITILPHLPGDIHYIIIWHDQKRGSRSVVVMKETKFKRRVIAEILDLLVATVEGVWKSTEVTINTENLNAWPEEGDITQMNPDVNIIEINPENQNEDEDGCERDEVQEEQRNASSRNSDEYTRVHDGDDFGPATLQNAEESEDQFQTTITDSVRNTADIDEAEQMLRDIAMDTTTTPRTAIFNQSEVRKVDGFVNMKTVKYAWARAFPKVYIPTYDYIVETNSWNWVIRHDMTGWNQMRDKKVDAKRWHYVQMWRYDGMPAAHPTFALALYNYKISSQLFKNASYVVNTTNINPTETMEEIRNADNEEEKRKGLEKLVEASHVHTASVPGTRRFWYGKANEFRAELRFNQFIKNTVPSYWHTLSFADHHEFPLRLLLHHYVEKIRPYGAVPVGIVDVLNDDGSFSKAAHTYKTITTHYFAMKEELWLGLMMNPIFGIDIVQLVHEFQAGRGAIHGHLIGSNGKDGQAKEILTKIQELLFNYAWDLHQSIESLDERILENAWDWNVVAVRAKIEEIKKGPHTNAMKERELCMISFRIPNRSEIQETHKKEVTHLHAKYSAEIGQILEKEWGHAALHHGIFPGEWVMPGGSELVGYRGTDTNNMMRSKDVLERKELKSMKLHRETELYRRKSNITNHCGTHNCSDYCLKNLEYAVEYDKDGEHKNVIDPKLSADGTKIILSRRECKVTKQRYLDFDRSPENNRTGGVPPSPYGGNIVFDKNQQPKFKGRRNHPRVLDQPHIAPYWNANTDLQHLLINANFDRTMELLDNDPEKYLQYYKNLLSLGCGGLEHHSGVDCLLDYLIAYECKGNVSTEEYNDTMKRITDDYCTNEENNGKTARGLVMKHMHQVMKGASHTKDMCQYLLAGGLLTRTTAEKARTASVATVSYSQLQEQIDAQDTNTAEQNANRRQSTKTFNWENVILNYRSRCQDLENVNVYTFCSKHWPGGKEGEMIPVNIYGFHDKATWPINEKYARWMLTLYHPWRGTVDSLLENENDTFADVLWRKCKDGTFQNKKVFFEIIRCQLNITVDVSESTLQNDTNETPTRDRLDDSGEDALNAAAAVGVNSIEDLDDDVHDLTDDMFDRLPLPDIDYDWRSSCMENIEYDCNKATEWLENEKKLFYDDKTTATIEGTGEVSLDEEEIYRPENARPGKQQVLIGLVLLQLYRFRNHNYGRYVPSENNGEENEGTNDEVEFPPCVHGFVEGKPGTGKSFILKTTRNIVKNVLKDNDSESSSAFTGCASALIGCGTNTREHSVPTGKEFSGVLTSKVESNLRKLEAQRIKAGKLFAKCFDEHSMDGRKMLGWLEHRMRESRQNVVRYNESGEVVGGKIYVPPELAKRPFGGPPYLISMGDLAQIPPIGDKPLYDMSASYNPSSADNAGKLVLQNLLYPKDTSEVEAAVIIMDEVIRQDDDSFKGFLTRMTEGWLNEDDIKWIHSRRLDNLEEQEQLRFIDAIHLVGEWKTAQEIIFEYLQKKAALEGREIAKYRPTYHTTRTDNKNCCLKERNYPKCVGICVGAVVMLLKNFIVEEWKLYNGSVGVVRDIIYDDKEGPRSGNLPKFIVVEFLESNVPEERKFHESLSRNYVAIPVTKDRCSCGRCTVETMPLRICIALTIHKSQGMTIGEVNKIFKYMVLHFSEKIRPGLDLVGCSRATGPDRIAFGNEVTELSKERFFKIGRLKSDEKRKEFMKQLYELEKQTLEYFKSEIGKLDESDEKTFENGYQLLVDWYRNEAS